MESIPQDYYVYFYRYPKSMGGAIFYVGKGKTYNDKYDRIDAHELEARGKLRSYNTRKNAIIKEIWAAGEEVAKEKVAFFRDEKDAYLYEWGLINMTTYAETLTNIDRGLHHPCNPKPAPHIPEAKCGYCGCVIPAHKVVAKSKTHYCCDDHIKRHYKYMNFARERKKRKAT